MDGSAQNFESESAWKTLGIALGANFSNACAGAAEIASAKASNKPSGRKRLIIFY